MIFFFYQSESKGQSESWFIVRVTTGAGEGKREVLLDGTIHSQHQR